MIDRSGWAMLPAAATCTICVHVGPRFYSRVDVSVPLVFPC